MYLATKQAVSLAKTVDDNSLRIVINADQMHSQLFELHQKSSEVLAGTQQISPQISNVIGYSHESRRHTPTLSTE